MDFFSTKFLLRWFFNFFSFRFIKLLMSWKGKKKSNILDLKFFRKYWTSIKKYGYFGLWFFVEVQYFEHRIFLGLRIRRSLPSQSHVRGFQQKVLSPKFFWTLKDIIPKVDFWNYPSQFTSNWNLNTKYCRFSYNRSHKKCLKTSFFIDINRKTTQFTKLA